MRHGKRGRKLGRTPSHKKATLNNLATALFAHGSVRTTRAKAKELRGVAERLITFAKRGDLHARRNVLRRIPNKVVVSKLFDEIGPAFAERQGGYTRVLKLGERRGDSVEMCLIELVGEEVRSDYAPRSDSRGQAAGTSPAPAAEAAEADAGAEPEIEAPVDEETAEPGDETEPDDKEKEGT
jgi:large subunit ribosomal protein L17